MTFERVRKACGTALRSNSAWSDRHAAAEYLSRSEAAIAKLEKKEIASVLMFGDEAALGEFKTDIESTLGTLSSEDKFLRQMRDGTLLKTLPVSLTISALDMVCDFYHDLHQSYSRLIGADLTRAKQEVAECSARIGKGIDLSEIQRLEDDFHRLNNDIFAAEAAVNAAAIKIREAPTPQERQERAEQLKSQESNLNKLKRESGPKLNSLVREFKQVRGQIVARNQRALPGKCLLDPQASIVLDGINSEKLKFLDLKSRADAEEFLSDVKKKDMASCPICMEDHEARKGYILSERALYLRRLPSRAGHRCNRSGLRCGSVQS